MTLKTITRVAVGISMLCSSTAFAQVSIQPLTSAEVEDESKRILGNGAPLSRVGSSVSASNLQVAVTEGEQEISLGVDFELFTTAPIIQPDGDDEFKVESLNLTFRGSAPLNGDDTTRSDVFSGGSIVSGTRVTAALTYFSARQRNGSRLFEPINMDESRNLYREILTACAKHEANALAGSSGAKQTLAANFISTIEAENTSRTGFAQFVRLDLPEQRPELNEFATRFSEKCTGGLDALVETYLPDAKNDFVRAAYTTSPMFFMGASGTVGDQSFQSLNRTDFVVEDVARTPWQADAYLGLISSDLNWSIRASVSHGNSYEAAENGEACRAGMDGTEECVMGPDGLPIRTEATRMALEGRRLFNIGGGQRIGIAPEFTYDFEMDDFQVEVPVYFSPDDKKQLTGGIFTRYESDDDDFSVGLFVGVPFSISF